MNSQILHPIRYVVQLTGLKAYLIRTWEERYGAICPQRSPGNRRLYTDEDIQRLKLLKRAVDCGHNISTVARLNEQDLEGLIEHFRQGRFSKDAVDASAPTAPMVVFGDDLEETVAQALDCVRQLDPKGFETVLSAAAVEIPRQALLQFVIVPLFVRVGELWRQGQLKIVNEHMASTIVRSMLWNMLRSSETTEGAPRVVVATPVGHWHEIGALAAAVAASESGWQPIYFGPNLPSDEIVYAVRKCDASALTLSLVHAIGNENLAVELANLRRALGPDLPILVGGPGIQAAAKILAQIKAIVAVDFQEYRDMLESCGRELKH